MKNRILIISLIVIIVIIGTFLIIGLTNKTYFKSYYEVTNKAGKKSKIPLPLFSYFREEHGKYNATFTTLRGVRVTQDTLSKYVENLHACYDEGYFYDKNIDITISKYYIENGFPFNKIYLTYDFGNYCENEFVLDNDWLTKVITKADIREVNINKCVLVNNNMKCDSKTVSKTDVDKFFDYANKIMFPRIENKNNITNNNTKTYYSITAYYIMDGSSYMLTAFPYSDTYLAIKITDPNDHSKNAIYDIGAVNPLLASIYNRY